VQVVGLTGDLNTMSASVDVSMYTCTVPRGSCRWVADHGTYAPNAADLPVMLDGRGVGVQAAAVRQ
jgi:hypothetical protein